MAETTQSTPSETASKGTAATTSQSPLTTPKGTTRIDDSVVAKVAGIAAREVSGVYALGGGGARAIGNVTQRVGLAESRTQGVSVEVGERQAAVDLTIVIEYGESIPRVTAELREQVIRRIEGTCGLEVTEVNIAVNDLHFIGDDDQDDRRGDERS